MKKRLPQRSEEVFSPSGGSTALPSLLRTFPGMIATIGSVHDREREEVGGGTDPAEELAAVAAR